MVTKFVGDFGRLHHPTLKIHNILISDWIWVILFVNESLLSLLQKSSWWLFIILGLNPRNCFHKRQTSKRQIAFKIMCMCSLEFSLLFLDKRGFRNLKFCEFIMCLKSSHKGGWKLCMKYYETTSQN